MTTLIIIQTVFYFLASIVMVAIGVLLGIAIYYLICILRNTKNISDDVTRTYNRTKKGIKKIISTISGKKEKNEKNKE